MCVLIFVSTAVLPLHRLTLFRGLLVGASRLCHPPPLVLLFPCSELPFCFQASRSSHELRCLTQGKAELSEDAEISVSTRAVGMVAASMVPNFLRLASTAKSCIEYRKTMAVKLPTAEREVSTRALVILRVNLALTIKFLHLLIFQKNPWPF